MARLISVREAAELLEVTHQTINNWIKKGRLQAHDVKERGKIVHKLDKSSIMSLVDSIRKLPNREDIVQMQKDIVELEKQLRQKKIELNKELIKVEDELFLLKRLARLYNINRTSELKRFVSICAVLLEAGYSLLSNKEHDILIGYIYGKSVSQIAQDYNISRERVLHIIDGAINKLSEIKSYGTILRENDKLKEEAQNYKKLYEIQNKTLEEYFNVARERSSKIKEAKSIISEAPILLEEIDKFIFSTRTKNVLKRVSIDTVADLIKYGQTNLNKLKNCGKKTIVELTSFLKDNSLDWDLDIDAESLLKIKFGKEDGNFVDDENEERKMTDKPSIEMSTLIDDSSLSNYTKYILRRAGVKTVHNLYFVKQGNFISIDYCGPSTKKEIEDFFLNYNIKGLEETLKQEKISSIRKNEYSDNKGIIYGNPSLLDLNACGFSSFAQYILNTKGIRTLGDIKKLNKDDISNLGIGVQDEIKKIMQRFGL